MTPRLRLLSAVPLGASLVGARIDFFDDTVGIKSHCYSFSQSTVTPSASPLTSAPTIATATAAQMSLEQSLSFEYSAQAESKPEPSLTPTFSGPSTGPSFSFEISNNPKPSPTPTKPSSFSFEYSNPVPTVSPTTADTETSETIIDIQADTNPTAQDTDDLKTAIAEELGVPEEAIEGFSVALNPARRRHLSAVVWTITFTITISVSTTPCRCSTGPDFAVYVQQTCSAPKFEERVQRGCGHCNVVRVKCDFVPRPTPSPTPAPPPTRAPIPRPTRAPTNAPTHAPTHQPTPLPVPPPRKCPCYNALALPSAVRDIECFMATTIPLLRTVEVLYRTKQLLPIIDGFSPELQSIMSGTIVAVPPHVKVLLVGFSKDKKALSFWQKGMFAPPQDGDSPYVIAFSGVGGIGPQNAAFFFTNAATLKPRSPPFQQLSIESLVTREWFKAARAFGNSSWSTVFVSAETGRAVVTPAVIIKNPKEKFLGIITAEISLGKLGRILADAAASSPMPEGTRIYIMEGNALVAASVPGVSFVNGNQVPVAECSDYAIRVSGRELTLKNFPSAAFIFAGFFIQARFVSKIAGLPFSDMYNRGWHVVIAQPNEGRRL